MLRQVHRLFFILTMGIVMLAWTKTAYACSCRSTGSVLDYYQQSDVVAILKIASLEKVKTPTIPATIPATIPGRIQSATLVVEKTYKGSVAVGDKLVFEEGSGGDCLWTFEDDVVGQEVLFFLDSPTTSERWWALQFCGRNRRIENAAADLLFLDNRSQLQGRTRISGKLRLPDGGVDWDLSGRTVRISSRVGKVETSHTTKTDKNGVYEIYDLPPGTYEIKLDLPSGWNGIPDAVTSTGLKRGRHVEQDFVVVSNAFIQANIIDSNGKAMEGVCLSFVSVRNPKHYFSSYKCSNKSGRFSIDGVGPGSYIVRIDTEWRDKPLRSFYYPGIFDPGEATPVLVGTGEHKRLDIRIPAGMNVESVRIKGVLTYLDGNPAPGMNVVFQNADGKASNGFVAKTRYDGRFEFRTMKGTAGKIFGSIVTESLNTEQCSEEQKTIGMQNPDTRSVDIEAERDQEQLILHFLFPRCSKSAGP